MKREIFDLFGYSGSCLVVCGRCKKLSKVVVEQIENNDLFISQMARLELQYLFEVGRITITLETVIKSLNKTVGLKVSLMKAEQVFDKVIEYVWTRDVFDRLITAEAEASVSILITKDKISVIIIKKHFGSLGVASLVTQYIRTI